MVNGKKTYYSISEVCSQTGLEPHVLRYWESEFPQLRPKKNRAGNRAYREKDIEIIRYIKHLLYEEQFTIPGAKKKISESREMAAEPQPSKTKETVEMVTDESAGEQVLVEAAPPAVTGAAYPQLDNVKKELKEILELLRK
jgi:DNA-binding transcriptional MerR regulator